MRFRRSSAAQGWNGNGSFMPKAMSQNWPRMLGTVPSGSGVPPAPPTPTLTLGVCRRKAHTPDRSGLPSDVLGAGAFRSTLPSGVRGAPAAGYAGHCPDRTGEKTMAIAMMAAAVRNIFMAILPPGGVKRCA